MNGATAADAVCERAAAIVVAYNADPDAIAGFADQLLDQFPRVIVVDNSDDAALRAGIRSELDARSVYVSMNGNAGIGAAQNRGIAEATREGAEYFVMFDQDSRPCDGFLRGLAEGLIEASAHQQVGAIGPLAVDAVTGDSYDVKRSEQPFVVETTLSSGLLITRSALNALGTMDESLFIDLVDWEWCFRAKSNGYGVLIDPRVSLAHRLGDHHTRVPLLGRVGTPQPWRHYYAFRNYVDLCRRGYVPLSWKLRYLFINSGKFLLYPLFMARGGERFGHMLAGIADGLAGRNGKRASP